MPLPLTRTLEWVQLDYTTANAGARTVRCGVRVRAGGAFGLDTVTEHVLSDATLTAAAQSAGRDTWDETQVCAALTLQSPEGLSPITVTLPEAAAPVDLTAEGG